MDSPQERRRSLSPAPRNRSVSPARDLDEREGSRGYDRPAPPRDDYRRDRGPPPPRGGGGKDRAPPEPNNVVGVFGLSMDTRESDLESAFDRMGRVNKVTIVYDQRSHQSRGFGFVEMESIEDAQKVIDEYNGYEMHGKRMRVDFSATRRPHDPTPGVYMGFKGSSRGPPPPRYGGRGDRYGGRDYGRDRYSSRYDDRYDDRYDRYDRYDDRRRSRYDDDRRSSRYDDDRRSSRYDDRRSSRYDDYGYDDRRASRYADDYDADSRGPAARGLSREPDYRGSRANSSRIADDDPYGVPPPGPAEHEPIGRRSPREDSPPSRRDLADAPARPSRDMY